MIEATSKYVFNGEKVDPLDFDVRYWYVQNFLPDHPEGMCVIVILEGNQYEFVIPIEGVKQVVARAVT